MSTRRGPGIGLRIILKIRAEFGYGLQIDILREERAEARNKPRGFNLYKFASVGVVLVNTWYLWWKDNLRGNFWLATT